MDGGDLAGPSPRPGDLPVFRKGDLLGRYVVLDHLGRGGMGTVYAAYDPELDRKVAIKVLRLGEADVPTRRRAAEQLMREAQALAKLAHPNVVTLFDVGSWIEGVFLATELVEGMTLRRWLGDCSRSVREVVQVFLAAGRGLAAAHSQGLIHRDFKPSNVMVGYDGRVRVLDFGLARWIGPTSTSNPSIISLEELASGKAQVSTPPLERTLTRDGALVGTPAFMAPEQYSGQELSAAVDQFSFCVALYQALYGELPFSGRGMGEEGAQELEWTVRPPAADRQVPSRLRRLLLTGLAVEPSERFASMDALLEQLSRNPSRRRWRGLVAGLVLGLLVLGTWLFQRASRDQVRLCRGGISKMESIWNPRRQVAMQSTFRASGKPFAEDAWAGTKRAVDRYAEGWGAMYVEACKATHQQGEQSQDLLDLRMDCLDRRREELAALLVLLERADDDLVARAVEATGELSPLSACADTRALLAPGPTGARAVGTQRLSIRQWLAEAKALEVSGRYQEGLPLARKAAELADQAGDRRLEAEALYRQGRLLGLVGEPAQAEATLVSASMVAMAGHDDRLAAASFVRLVRVVGVLHERHAEGHRLSRLAKDVLVRLSRPEDLEAALADEIGTIYFLEADYPRALEHHRKALDLQEAQLASGHPDLLGSRIRIANVLWELGQREAAISETQAALVESEAAYGTAHPKVALTLANLGLFFLDQGQVTQARESLDRALTIRQQALEPDHPDLAETLSLLGNVELAAGQSELAIELYSASLRAFDQSLGSEHPSTGLTLSALGAALALRGDPKAAVENYRRAHTILEKVYGSEHPLVLETSYSLASSLKNAGSCQQALEIFQQVAGAWDQEGEKEHPLLAHALTGIGQCWLSLAMPSRGLRPLERAVWLRQKAETDPLLLANSQFALAQALAGLGRDEGRAQSLAETARAAFVAAGEAGQERRNEIDRWVRKLD